MNVYELFTELSSENRLGILQILNEKSKPFPAGKMKHLAVGFDGTIVNAAESLSDF